MRTNPEFPSINIYNNYNKKCDLIFEDDNLSADIFLQNLNKLLHVTEFKKIYFLLFLNYVTLRYTPWYKNYKGLKTVRARQKM